MASHAWKKPSVTLLATLTLLGAACTKKDATSTPSSSPSPTESSVIVGPTESPSQEPTEAPTEPALDLAGTWTGHWANETPDNAEGTFEIQWEQHGDTLVGTISISGTPCLDGGSIEGKLREGKYINFGVVQGQVEVNYTGTVKDDTMSGRYATSCGNAEGNWEASRTG